ncbi:serine hydrolase [Nocardia sp. GCM10030253]|uniref:serine hydrolase n=1 Tax=Nocardia sp. GCM10030253 TaxID=3273404 RepID=UPI00363CBC39
MHKKPIRIAAVPGSLIFVSALTFAQVTASPREEAMAAGAARVAATSATDVVLRVSDTAGARVGAANTAGLAHRGQLGTNSHFRIGSVAKTFVGTVVLQLADEGGSDWTDRSPNSCPASVLTVVVASAGASDLPTRWRPPPPRSA